MFSLLFRWGRKTSPFHGFFRVRLKIENQTVSLPTPRYLQGVACFGFLGSLTLKQSLVGVWWEPTGVWGRHRIETNVETDQETSRYRRHRHHHHHHHHHQHHHRSYFHHQSILKQLNLLYVLRPILGTIFGLCFSFQGVRFSTQSCSLLCLRNVGLGWDLFLHIVYVEYTVLVYIYIDLW